MAEKVPGQWGPGAVLLGTGRARHGCFGTGREAARDAGIAWALHRPRCRWDGMGRAVRFGSPRPGRVRPTPHGGGARQPDVPLPGPGAGEGFGSERGHDGGGRGLWCQCGAGGQGAGAGGLAGPVAACPRCRCQGWHWGRCGSCSHLRRHGRAACTQPPAWLSCAVGTGSHTGHQHRDRLGPQHSDPLAQCPWLPCPRGAQGTWEPRALRVAPRVPGAGWWWEARVVPRGSLPGTVGHGGSVYPFLSSNHFLSFLLAVSSSFKERDRFPQPPPLQHWDPQHARSMCPLQRHQPGWPPAHRFPARWAERLRSPPPHSHATPPHHGTRRWYRRCSPLALGWVMGAWVMGGAGAWLHTWVPFPAPEGRGAPRGKGPGATRSMMAGASLPFLGDSFSPVRL
ncbi:spidroin-2-like [Falco cherrug]|uniref:spidroin-2-like n=1 Tax=Falco cherrug TaxID=345164 RepID=UPI002478AEE6|nr:spidroin-2-like [Falco cherrug]